MTYPEHISVLKEEVLSIFERVHLPKFVDATYGAGGRSAALRAAHPEMELISFDQDPRAGATFQVNFRHLAQYVKGPIDGILFDLGVSSMQLDTAERGFSYSKEAILDMRMDPSQQLTAEAIVNEWSEEELTRIFRDYGELRAPHKVARRIIEHRPIHTTTELAKLVGASAPLFQALRIAVNDELNAIEVSLQAAIHLLRPGGRIAVISFHSLEDRIVKTAFKSAASRWEEDRDNPYTGRREKQPSLKLITRKPIVPSREEIRRNPRARSAKLRAAEKI